MKIVLPSTIALSAICAITALMGAEQPKFEVASVKRVERGSIKNSLGPATVELKGDPLKLLLMEAFKVKTDQIIGPSWLDEDCFDITAKMPEGATSDQIPAMLEALLVERFKLVAHKEDRPRPVYALVVEKSGPKFKEAASTPKPFGAPSGRVSFRAQPGASGINGSMTMASLARFLSLRLDHAVQDFTGLKGTYDIDLSWATNALIDRPSQFAAPNAAAPSSSANVGIDLPAAPTADIFSAVRESLGLKLESRKEPVEMLIIDQVERVPTSN